MRKDGQPERFLEQDDAVKEARAADVQIQDKDISKEELRSRKYEEKKGMTI